MKTLADLDKKFGWQQTQEKTAKNEEDRLKFGMVTMGAIVSCLPLPLDQLEREDYTFPTLRGSSSFLSFEGSYQSH